MTTRRRLPGTPEPTRTWTLTNGLRIAGDVWGTPGHQAVVLLHGGGQTRHAWRGTGKQLGDAGYHAIAIDARGHGDSDWPADGVYSSESMVGDLVALLRQLTVKPPILIGASIVG